jgi:hypothetical protein
MSVSRFIQAKARRILCNGRLTVGYLDGRLVADVVGDHDRYRVEIGDRGPRCPCPSRKRPCSHELAAALISGWKL